MSTKASEPDIPDTVGRTIYWSVPGKRRLPAWIAAVAFAAPFLVFWSAGIRINCSPSLPLGLYKSREAGGSGLGLAIVQWVVQAHKGAVLVSAAPSGGSVFRIVLPVRQHTI